MQIDFNDRIPAPGSDTAHAVLVCGETLSLEGRALDEASGGLVSRAIAASRFTGAPGEVLELIAPAGLTTGRIVIVGAGVSGLENDAAVEAAAAEAYRRVSCSGAAELILDFGLSSGQAAHAAFAVRLAAYRFDRYRTREKPERKPSVTGLRVLAAKPEDTRQAFAPLDALATAVLFSRDLISEPGNTLYPKAFASRMSALESLGLKVEVLGEAEMKALGMGALLGVGQGSEHESQLVVATWSGAEDETAAPICFVGKGVCFDSGGISIKPSAGMDDMKTDMGGAAAVAGVMHALAGRKARINAVGVLGLVENMPDGKAQRPGDVVVSMSGQTIEVLDTDAEGRLVLADALWYAQERFKPRQIIDLATLTGAVVVALGPDIAGLFSNDDALAVQLTNAGLAEKEPVWRLPLPADYERLIDSTIADVKNLGGRGAGAITAALFLQRFVKETPWAHLDIAAPVWRKDSKNPTVPDGATGFGVRLLNRLVSDLETSGTI